VVLRVHLVAFFNFPVHNVSQLLTYRCETNVRLRRRAICLVNTVWMSNHFRRVGGQSSRHRSRRKGNL